MMLSPSIPSNQGWNGTLTALRFTLDCIITSKKAIVGFYNLLNRWLSLFQIPTQQNLYIHRRGTGVGQPLQDAGHLWPAAHGGVPRPGDVWSPAPRVRGGWRLPEGPKTAGNPILRKVTGQPSTSHGSINLAVGRKPSRVCALSVLVLGVFSLHLESLQVIFRFFALCWFSQFLGLENNFIHSLIHYCLASIRSVWSRSRPWLFTSYHPSSNDVSGAICKLTGVNLFTLLNLVR